MAHPREGLVGRPFTLVVELGKVREFAAATKSANPAYQGGVGSSPTSPATFLQAAAFWQTPESSPLALAELDYERLLHGEQEFIFHGPPPHVGDVLVGQARVEKVYEKSGRRGGTMTFTEVVTEYRNEAGQKVAEARATYIETSQPTV